jgi:hypothetical protein
VIDGVKVERSDKLRGIAKSDGMNGFYRLREDAGSLLRMTTKKRAAGLLEGIDAIGRARLRLGLVTI